MVNIQIHFNVFPFILDFGKSSRCSCNLWTMLKQIKWKIHLKSAINSKEISKTKLA